jgi:hypothetical protein
MSDTQTQLSPESQKALEQQVIKQKFDELTGISRLVVNTLNLLCSNDITIPSAYAKPVAEIQDWLNGMHQNVQQNLNVVKALLPQEPSKSDVTAPVTEVAKAAPAVQPEAKEPILEVKG